MDISKIEKIVYDLTLPIVNSLGYELVDVEFIKERNEWYLRVYIDKNGGITIDDCSNVSKLLSNKLDEIDPIDCRYYLEVSSPGLNRKLKKESDFIKYKGKNIKIKLNEAIQGRKVITGKLVGVDENNIFISINDNIYSIDKKKIITARLNDI